MTAAALFALAVAAAAVALGVKAVREKRWPEVGMCASALVLAGFLAAVAAAPTIPLWLVLMVAWAVLVLLAVAVWSLIRSLEKERTGEGTR